MSTTLRMLHQCAAVAVAGNLRLGRAGNGMARRQKHRQDGGGDLCHLKKPWLLAVAREFDSYPADLRLILRTLCNARERCGQRAQRSAAAGPVDGGKLREETHAERFQAKTRDGCAQGGGTLPGWRDAEVWNREVRKRPNVRGNAQSDGCQEVKDEQNE